MGNRKDLTREWLQSLGITLEFTRGTRPMLCVVKSSKRRGTVVLKPVPQIGKNDLAHYYYCFCVKKVRYKISCARVIYALKYGVCPANKVVTYDENGDLVLMTQKELYHKKVWNRR